MFERYTEKARRVIFFARYEASQTGSHVIDAEHLLLGLLREAKHLFEPGKIQQLRDELRAGVYVDGPEVSTKVDLPLTLEAKRVLAYAAEESERVAQKYIGPEHLLLGLLRDPETLAAKTLIKHGVELEPLRQKRAYVTEHGGQAPNVVIELRWAFEPLLERLSPDVEPALIYSPEAGQ